MTSRPTPTPGFIRFLERWGEHILTFVVFAVVVGLKLRMIGTHPHIGWDGGLFFDVAQNIRNGDGLRTNVSIYHHGYPYFPHPTSLYPLWPIVLAPTLFFLPTQIAASWVPSVLFVASIVLAFAWGRRVVPPGRMALGVHGGHVLVAIMGLHLGFQRACGMPYTEALWFLLVGASLLRGRTLFERMWLRDGVELGLWCGALFLTRSQAVTTFLAVLVTTPLLLVLRERPLQVLRFIAAACGAFALAFAPMWWWMSTFLERPSLHAYFDLAYARVSSALSPQTFTPDHESVGAFINMVLHGVRVAFTPKTGYPHAFGAFAYVVPLAAVVGIAWLARRRVEGLRTAWRALRDPKIHGAVWAFFCALGGFALLHVAQRQGDRWWFADRHAMPAGLFFFFCFAAIVAVGRVGRWIALVAFLCAAVSLGIHDVQEARALRRARPFAAHNEALAQWLERARKAEGKPLMVTLTSREARLMGWRVPGVGYQSVSGKTRYADLVIMMRDLGAKYAIFSQSAGRYKKAPTFAADFEEVTKVGRGREAYVIYRWRGRSWSGTRSLPGRRVPSRDLEQGASSRLSARTDRGPWRRDFVVPRGGHDPADGSACRREGLARGDPVGAASRRGRRRAHQRARLGRIRLLRGRRRFSGARARLLNARGPWPTRHGLRSCRGRTGGCRRSECAPWGRRLCRRCARGRFCRGSGRRPTIPG